MKFNILLNLSLFSVFITSNCQPTDLVIRINQLGYSPAGVKVAVFASKTPVTVVDFELFDSASNQPVFKGRAGFQFGKSDLFKVHTG